MVVRLVAMLIGLGIAGFMPAFSMSTPSFAKPPSDGVVELISLGRSEAAGSLLWILATQQVSRAGYAEAGFPNLEDWLETVFRHNPYLSDGYTLGTVLLLTDRERAPRMDRLLERAEARYPTNYEFPMLRGISSYFGALDAGAAAGHFERAATREGAPTYLTQFAQRLRREVASCGVMVVNMKSLAEQTNQRALMTGQLEGVYLRCIEREIEQAATSFRLNRGRNPTLDELRVEGYLKQVPPAPPGKCWVLINIDAFVQPCQAPTP